LHQTIGLMTEFIPIR